VKQRCGNCKYHVPEEKNMILRALSKYPWPYCAVTKKPKPYDELGCLIWVPKQIKPKESH
jgi:hypothetical protein